MNETRKQRTRTEAETKRRETKQRKEEKRNRTRLSEEVTSEREECRSYPATGVPAHAQGEEVKHRTLEVEVKFASNSPTSRTSLEGRRSEGVVIVSLSYDFKAEDALLSQRRSSRNRSSLRDAWEWISNFLPLSLTSYILRYLPTFPRWTLKL